MLGLCHSRLRVCSLDFSDMKVFASFSTFIQPESHGTQKQCTSSIEEYIIYQALLIGKDVDPQRLWKTYLWLQYLLTHFFTIQ